MDPKQTNSQFDPGTYQTGRTEPPRHYSGLVAFLLVLVILLCGIATALSILNLRLYKELTTQETTPQVAFSRAEENQVPSDYHSEDIQLPQLGIYGTVIPGVYQRYYKLPNGFYITQVTAGGQAAQKGLLAGDIITQINGSDIIGNETVTALTQELEDGDTIQLTLYRSGSEVTAILAWED